MIEKAQMASRAQRVLAALQESQDCRRIEDAMLEGPPRIAPSRRREASLARPRRISVECEWFGSVAPATTSRWGAQGAGAAAKQ